jgi:hypothetical protein
MRFSLEDYRGIRNALRASSAAGWGGKEPIDIEEATLS